MTDAEAHLAARAVVLDEDWPKVTLVCAGRRHNPYLSPWELHCERYGLL